MALPAPHPALLLRPVIMVRKRFSALLLVLACVASTVEVCADEQRDFFETKIRPVLVKHCYECHSADSDSIGGNLLVDRRDGMLVGGESGPVVVPGKPDESLIVQALRYEDLEMPPEAPLPEAVINDFVKWISLGATDPRVDAAMPTPKPTGDLETLWSFMPRQVPALPDVQHRDWPRDPIDHFVLARLEQNTLEPTHDATPQTLVRRLYYDLIGLPPTHEQVNEFVDEYSRDAISATESVVDSLLASPQYGVRWGRHWLDVARYGESNGDDGLGRNATFPHAWRYRDYVVDAFNHDVPYDQFLTEQIAGDLLPAESAEQRNRQLTATGFLAIGSKPASAMNTNFAMDVVDDQINVVCTGVMGLSVACARCHDHKHDPIPTRDYYALAGIFSSTETLYGAAGNEKLTAPPTPLHELKSTWNESEAVAPDRTSPPKFPDNYSKQIDELSPSLHCKLDSVPDGLTVTPDASYSTETFALVKDTTIRGTLPEKTSSYSVSFWFKNSLKNDARPITAYLFSRAKFGDKTLPGDHIGIGGNHESTRSGKIFVFNGNEAKKTLSGSTVIARDTWNHVVLVRDAASIKLFLNGQLEIDGELKPAFGESTEICLANRSDNFAPLDGHMGEFALFARALAVDDAVHLHTASGQPRGVRPSPVDGYAMGVLDKKKPGDSKVHINGEGSKLGPVVPRGVLTSYRTALHIESSPGEDVVINEKESGRAALASWLVRPDHPQTARVMANRVWMHLFGQGIVATPDDFGVYGARPSHPELLDHLAERFVNEQWSIKRLIRAIVLSRTYQLASACDERVLESDPDNRWLARHNRRRLDAESLRDSMLQACGSIDYSPEKGSAIETVDALINWPPGAATNLHRESNHRSIYLCLLRHAPPKELVAFDLPDGVTVAGSRETTTLPTQSLFLLNSDFVVKQSRALAQRLLQHKEQDDADRVRRLFSLTLHRDASERELASSIDYVRTTEAAIAKTITQPDERQLRAWASLCQALLTTNEFRYVD